MSATGHPLLRAALPALLIALVAATGRARTADPQQVADDALDALHDALRGPDLDAVRLSVRQLDEVWDQLDERTGEKACKAVAGILELRPRHSTGEEGLDEHEELLDAYSLAVAFLFEKPPGGELLEDALRFKHLKTQPDVLALILEGLGLRAEADRVDVFLDRLDDEEIEVAAAAVNALANYRDADGELRKEIVEALVDAYHDLDRDAEREARHDKDTEARDRLARLEGNFDRTLVRLTGVDIVGATSWKGWWDDVGLLKDDW